MRFILGVRKNNVLKKIAVRKCFILCNVNESGTQTLSLLLLRCCTWENRSW